MVKRIKRRGIIFVVILCVIAALLGVMSYILEKYTIRTIYVEGNVHYTEDEIKDLVMTGPLGKNSLYLSLKYKSRGVENIPFVDVMNVEVLSPDTIKIAVYEKVLVGYVKYLDTYMYFDKDGYVVETSSVRTVGIPQVMGLAFDHVVLGEPLPVEDPKVFENILNLTKLINKYGLVTDRLYFHPSGDITLYFGEIKVALGQEPEHMEDKMLLLPEFLGKLEGKSGTLEMEKYDGDGGKYSFQPD